MVVLKGRIDFKNFSLWEDLLVLERTEVFNNQQLSLMGESGDLERTHFVLFSFWDGVAVLKGLILESLKFPF